MKKHTLKRFFGFLFVSLISLSSLTSCFLFDLFDDPSTTDSHDIDYSTYKYDNFSHWHPCKDPNCKTRHGEEEHIMPSIASIVKEPTCTEDGVREMKCIICDYKLTMKIPALGHDISSLYKSNSTGHWHPCSRCNEKIDFSPHDYSKGVWTVIKKPTYTEEGLKTITCRDCDYVLEVKIPKLEYEEIELENYKKLKDLNKEELIKILYEDYKLDFKGLNITKKNRLRYIY